MRAWPGPRRRLKRAPLSYRVRSAEVALCCASFLELPLLRERQGSLRGLAQDRLAWRDAREADRLGRDLDPLPPAEARDRVAGAGELACGRKILAEMGPARVRARERRRR